MAASAGPDKGLQVPLPVKGKELVMTPDETFSLRAQYHVGPLQVGVQGKYVSSRWADDINSQQLPGYVTADLDVSYVVPGSGGHAVFSVNATNFLNNSYIVRLSTVGAANPVQIGPDTVNASSAFYYYSAPAMVFGKLAVKW